MDPYKLEKKLGIFYPIIIGLCVICSVTSAVAWSHWKYVLDHCVESNCGCFLYGGSARLAYYFTGGGVGYCHFAVYGIVFPGIFAVIFGSYHTYRTCIGTGKRKSGSTTVQQRSGQVVVLTAQSELSDHDISHQYWVITSVVASFMFVYTLIYASIFTDGINETCKEYRNELVKIMIAGGNTVAAIKGRISCAAVFDFMDYLHLDISPYRVRTGRINSASCYYMAVVSSWLAVVLWLAIAIINIRFARQSRSVSL